jgi:prepilin-type N-terminal cleavage/methylation domain-containing protein
MRCSRSFPQAGFTLIEVLVSITMMAMVAAVVVSAMRSGLSMWDKGTKHIETLRRSRVVLDLLNDQIRGALPLTYIVRAGDRIATLPAFDGARTSMRFATRTSFKDGPDGIPRWVSVAWTPDAETRSGQLIVEERRILPPDNAAEGAVYWRGTVFRGESCIFQFLLEAQAGKPAVWLEDWHFPPHTTLPRAVRLNCVSETKTSMQSVLPLDYAASSAAGWTLR